MMVGSKAVPVMSGHRKETSFMIMAVSSRVLHVGIFVVEYSSAWLHFESNPGSRTAVPEFPSDPSSFSTLQVFFTTGSCMPQPAFIQTDRIWHLLGFFGHLTASRGVG
jgi:hypothetical protein